MREVVEYTIMSKQGLSTAAFTAAVTDIITSNAHGLTNGTPVVLSTDGTLPAGLATSTVYYVIEATTNTFKLSLSAPPFDYTTGSVPPAPVPIVDITDTGASTHTWTEHDIGRNIFCRDYRHAVISVANTTAVGLTLKFVGALMDSSGNEHTCPDFSATQSNANMWDYVEVIDLEDGAAIDGDTGITPTAADNRVFEVNVNGLDWINTKITGWTSGDVSVVVKLYNE